MVVDVLDLWHLSVIRHVMDHGDVTLVHLGCVNALINILDLRSFNALRYVLDHRHMTCVT